MSFFSRFFKSRDRPQNRFGGSLSFLFGGTNAGKVVNEYTAMQTTAVYACVRLLAESLAGLPLHIYEYENDGKQKRVTDHPLPYLLQNEPNPEMSGFIWRETLMGHLLIFGNAFSQIVRNGRGRILGLYPLLPNKMKVGRAPNGEIIYTYQRDSEESRLNTKQENIVLRQHEVLHIPGLSFDGLIGYSPIAVAKNAIGMALATEEYGAAFFANGATPSGILEHPGVVKDPKAVRESWNAAYGGNGNSHRVAVLEDGMKFNQISIPPEQAQFLQTRRFQINEIARLFHVPPHMIGDLEKSSFNNIECQSMEFVKYSLNPWVIRWEQAMQQSLLLPSEKQKYFIKFNVDGLLRGDYGRRMAGYATARQNGWMSANEIRALEGFNQIPAELGGDLFLVNGNMCKLANAGAFAEKSTAETTETPMSDYM
ncbi:MAG: phage portal protein [Defluviitaleaceae bacterium]|nr:phage portal protein [Defluviitaleaceae bacterium]